MKITNVGPHSIDLDDGRSLGPGDSATVDAIDPTIQSYVDRDRVLVDEEKTPKRTTASDENREDKQS